MDACNSVTSLRKRSLAALRISGELDRGHPAAPQLTLERVAIGQGRREPVRDLASHRASLGRMAPPTWGACGASAGAHRFGTGGEEWVRSPPVGAIIMLPRQESVCEGQGALSEGAGVAEPADAVDSHSAGRKPVWVDLRIG